MARIVWGTPPWRSAPGAQGSIDPVLPGNTAIVVATDSPAQLAGKATSVTSGGDRLLTTLQGRQFYFPFTVVGERSEEGRRTADVWSFLHAGIDFQARAGQAVDGTIRRAVAHASAVGRAFVTGPGAGSVTMVASLQGSATWSTDDPTLGGRPDVIDEADVRPVELVIGESYTLTMVLIVSVATRAHEVPADLVPALSRSLLKVDENSPGFEIRVVLRS